MPHKNGRGEIAAKTGLQFINLISGSGVRGYQKQRVPPPGTNSLNLGPTARENAKRKILLSGKTEFPHPRCLFVLMALHAAQNIVEHPDRREYMRTLVEHDAIGAL